MTQAVWLAKLAVIRWISWALVLTLGPSAAQANADLGWRIITERSLGNCGACHAWQAAPASTSSFAPSLDGVAQRYSAAQLKQWVVDPRHLRPDTLMPVFGSLSGLRQPAPAQAVLSPEQIDAVVVALQQRTVIAHTPSAPPAFSPPASAPVALTPSQKNPAPDARGRISGLAFLSPSLRQMNDDDMANPEDQIGVCRQRQGSPSAQADDTVLALSAALHHAARGEPIAVQAPPARQAAWQARWQAGADQYQTRQGRMNLSCAHCHDDRVGTQMRGDTISPGHPTGFPIYRLSWQQAGGMDRRLRACFSGVQSAMPEPGSAILRSLELYLKVRANGMPIEGPSVRR